MTTYRLHYAPRTKRDATWMPPIPGVPANLSIRPLCHTRGRVDVTADKSRVTCSACITRMK